MKAAASTSYLPGMGSLHALGAWIEHHEELLCQNLLASPEDGALCAVFLSRDAQGEFLLRRCEGRDDGFMVWREQRRLRSVFGESYALAQLKLWLDARERQGYRCEWSAQRQLQTAFMPMSAAA